jgi:diguanylate cyclase (GGDEF)-like protein
LQSDDDVSTRVTRVTWSKELEPFAQGEDCLVIIYTSVPTELGKRHVLSKALTTIGRGSGNDIVVPSDAVSRNHARLERRGSEFVVSDLNSTNGTFINNELGRVQQWRLNRGDQIRVGDTVFKYLAGSDIETQYHAVIGHMAVTDGLTNLCNRKQLDAWLMEEVQRAQRHARELSLLMLDIDNFKHINDTHGHLAGDRVLSGLALLLQQRLRPNDRLGRFGGEEFCAILPETALPSAAHVAETLRAMVAGQTFAAGEQRLSVTVSIGAAMYQPPMGFEDLYHAADRKMYQAKHLGRDRVCY